VNQITKLLRDNLLYKPADAIAGFFGYRFAKLKKQKGPFAALMAIADGLNIVSIEPIERILVLLSSAQARAIITPSLNAARPTLGILSNDKYIAAAVLFTAADELGCDVFCRAGDGYCDASPNAAELVKLCKDRITILFANRLTREVLTIFDVEFWVDEPHAYTLSSANYISRRIWKETAQQTGLFEHGKVSDLTDLLPAPHSMFVDFPIDLVFTWVNADDPDWQRLYSQFRPEKATDGNSRSRFHSRDELKYALRSWDLYAPFIRKVFVVSNCAPPDWLDLQNGRVRWVWHEEILPASALPTFSSHAIETSLHHIDGLSRNFIYSNDDNLLLRPAQPDDFFYPNGIAKVCLEPYGMVTGKAVAGHPDYLNGARNANVIIERLLSKTPTQLVTHSPQPLNRDVLFELEALLQVEFAATAHNRFRSYKDVAVTGYLHAHYAIITGRAVADQKPVMLIQQNHDFVGRLTKLENKRKFSPRSLPLSVCLNDGADSHLNEEWNRAVTHFLDLFWPSKSSFER